ncbi:MAG: T9SS type A sorting domain-containing protein [Prevotellaceae bacterium]|jgi:hypothetical protein|nr:T9SS type A sorting domain-containing protein [Prevotellaceae bacterium]
MKKFYKQSLYIALLLLVNIAQNSFAQYLNPNNIIMLNTGKMGIASSIILKIDGSVEAAQKSQILCDGEWRIMGSFFHEADTNAFVTDNAGKTTSVGKVVFFNESAGKKRFIAPLNVQTDEFASAFNRAKNYIAFPNIVINTSDTVFVPAKMALDAISITDTLFNGAHSGGKLLLASAELANGKVYDASLRITGHGNSSNLVAKNAVIVEKWVETYRSNSGQLFSYATPFDNTQLAGYFAGNWLRTPSKDANGHSVYVLANKPSAQNSNIIATDQYVSWVFDALHPAQPYFIKPRVSGFPYGDLVANNGLNYTYGGDANIYDKDKFVFNGDIYNIMTTEEQLFADDVLFSHTFSGGTASATINWIIGNSYTSAISIDSLVKRLKAETTAGGIKFVETIYVFPAGSTSYQLIDISNPDPILLGDFKEIPAMSIFMIRIKKGSQLPNGTFTLGKDLVVHSNTQNNFAGSDVVQSAPSRARIIANTTSNLSNQVIFTASDAENDNVFDLAAIGLRQNALWAGDDYDFSKIAGSGDGFQLYTVLSDKTTTQLSLNGLPLDADSALMYFNPKFKADGMEIKLSVQGKETLTSEDFWLEDLQNGVTHRFENNEPYYFASYSDDDPARFVVHFKQQNILGGTTKDEQIKGNELTLYSVDKQIFIENLLPSDLNTDVKIYDVTGRMVDYFTINQFPKMIYNTKNLIDGAYFVRLQGVADRAKTLKMIIK